MPGILVLDNYDSFTYNLVQYVRELAPKSRLTVRRNDAIGLEAVAEYDKILLSPGPGLPQESGILCELIAQYAPQKSILGICLGHQAMAEVFGGQLINLSRVAHGISTTIHVQSPRSSLFEGLPDTIEGGLYHSWAVARETLPECFAITALSDQEVVMGIAHQTYDLEGLQFHPESVLTPTGKDLLNNWLRR